MLSFIVNRELGNYVGNYYCGYCTVCDWLSGAARRGRVEGPRGARGATGVGRVQARRRPVQYGSDVQIGANLDRIKYIFDILQSPKYYTSSRYLIDSLNQSSISCRNVRSSQNYVLAHLVFRFFLYECDEFS